MSNRAQEWAWELQVVERLPPTSHHVLLSIAEHWHPDHAAAWPSYARICERTGLSERAVRNAIEKLVARRLVTVEPRLTKGGRKIGNLYRLPTYDDNWVRERKAVNFGSSGQYDPSLSEGMNSIVEPPEEYFEDAENPWVTTAF